MIKAKMKGLNAPVEPLIENFPDYISKEQFRLDDGILVRNRAHDNTLWLDDLFMSVPALAQMGHYSGEDKFFDDAVKQINQFLERMFNEGMGLYMHGRVQGMEHHPEFYRVRANGWVVMAMLELLEMLPKRSSWLPWCSESTNSAYQRTCQVSVRYLPMAPVARSK